MAKYSTEFKVKIVKEYLESNISYRSLSDKYCIPSEIVVINWVNAYKSQGYEGLKVKRKNTQYTLEFKLNVVNLYLRGEMSYQSLANELKINNPSMITRWVKDFREKGIEGLKAKKRARASKMPKSQKKSKDTKVNSSTNLTKLENDSLIQAQLKENDITQSMSRKGNCLDNSAMENFFGILKQEIYYGNKFYSYEHLKQSIKDYIKYYNEQRIKEKLGYLLPVEYRKKNAA
ncbi:MAG: IS3 family transposase [Anaerococcus sp.]|nr:IS3 family transposase [Anaerococcus sp.]